MGTNSGVKWLQVCCLSFSLSLYAAINTILPKAVPSFGLDDHGAERQRLPQVFGLVQIR